MGRVLYVRGFPSSFANQDLKAKFMPFGLVKKARVTFNEQKLFGIVTYYYEDHAKIAMQAMNSKTIDGITWFVVECENGTIRNSFRHKEIVRDQNRQKTLYLRDFPSELTTDKLKEKFEKYGVISSVSMKDEVAFVTFDNPESAGKALEAEKLMKLEGKRVFVNKLQKKSKISNAIIKKINSKMTEKNKSTGLDVEKIEEKNEDLDEGAELNKNPI